MSNVTALKIEPDSSQLEFIREKVDTISKQGAIKAVGRLVNAQGVTAFELGGMLNRVKGKKLWPDADNVKFIEWMDKQGILKSRGYALISTYKVIISCDLPHDIVDRIGWSKLVMIVPLLKSDDDKFNEGLIVAAELFTQLQLREHVREVLGKKDAAKDGAAKRLRSAMKKFEPEEVLEMFAEIWPDIDVSVKV
jgi:hypothetical protein